MDPTDSQTAERPVRIEGYKVLGEVGRGGFGVVWKAEHTALGRMVAIKVLRSLDLMESADLRERFHREARVVARMATHENIVQVYDIKEAGGVPCIIMEFVEGQSLGAYLAAQGRLPLRLAIDIVAQTALGLHHAHTHGITHRDVKPENIMITTSGRVKVMDFGIARATTVSRMTATGLLVGTPQYMAPEQWDAKGEIDGRADIYALSVVLFHIVCGRPPFAEPNWYSLGMKHMNTPPPSPMSITPFIPPALETIILKGMAKNPADRYQSALDMHRALAGLLSQSGNTTEATPPGMSSTMTAAAAAAEPEMSPQLARLLKKSREMKGIGAEDGTLPPGGDDDEVDLPEGTLPPNAPTKKSSVQAGPALNPSATGHDVHNLRTQQTPGSSQPGPAQEPPPKPAPPRIQHLGPPAPPPPSPPPQPSPHVAVTPHQVVTKPQPRVQRPAAPQPPPPPPPPAPDQFAQPYHTNLMSPDAMPTPQRHQQDLWLQSVLPNTGPPPPMVAMPMEAAYPMGAAPMPRRRRRGRWLLLFLLSLVLLGGGGYAAWHFYPAETQRWYRTAMLESAGFLERLGTLGAPAATAAGASTATATSGAGSASVTATQQAEFARAAEEFRADKREAAYDRLKALAGEATGVDPAVLLYELGVAFAGAMPEAPPPRPAMTPASGGSSPSAGSTVSSAAAPGAEMIAVLDFATPGAPPDAHDGMSFALALIPDLRSPEYRVLKRPALMRILAEARLQKRPDAPDDAKLVGIARAAGVRFLVGGELTTAPAPQVRVRIVDTEGGHVVIDETLRAASLAGLRAELSDAGRRYALRLGKM